MNTPRDILDFTYPALEHTMEGLSPVHTRTLWKAVYRDAGTGFANLAEFPRPLRRWIESSRVHFTHLEVHRDIASADGWTRKFLLRLRDGHTVETVLMGYPGRFTACISSQVGCAMSCVFCATGQAGFTRHLASGEMVAQVLHCQRLLREQGEAGLRNLVFMGMGEPLHNYDAVMTALETITDTRGLNIGPRRISIGTVGVIPGILRLAEENRPYNLAVSLHGATPGQRAALVPVSNRWPLDELLDACRIYAAKTGRKIFFAWTLIAGRNDSPQTAAKLGSILEDIPAHVNLIPLNPTHGYEGVASQAAAEFQGVLRAAGIPSTVRQHRGIDVAAGCGQLGAARDA